MIVEKNIGIISNGDTVTVDFTITGLLNESLTNVTYTLTIPTGLTYDSETLSAGTYDNGTGKWTIPTQASNVTVTGSFNFTVADSTLQSYDVKLELDSGFVQDIDLSDNSVTKRLIGIDGSSIPSITTYDAGAGWIVTANGPGIVVTGAANSGYTVTVPSSVVLINASLAFQGRTGIAIAGNDFYISVTVVGGVGNGTIYNSDTVNGTDSKYINAVVETALPPGNIGFAAAPSGSVNYEVSNTAVNVAGQSTITVSYTTSASSAPDDLMAAKFTW